MATGRAEVFAAEAHWGAETAAALWAEAGAAASAMALWVEAATRVTLALARLLRGCGTGEHRSRT